MKIQPKLLLLFLVVSLPPLLFNSILSYSTDRERISQQIFNHLESVASLQHDRLENTIDHNLKSLDLISSRLQLPGNVKKYLASADPQEQERIISILNAAQTSSRSFHNISLITPEGNILASTAIPPFKKHITLDEDLIQRGKNDKHFKLIQLNKGLPPLLLMAAPLTVQGELVGILLIEAGIDEIAASLFNYTGLGNTGETILVSQRQKDKPLFLMPTRFDEDAAFTRTMTGENFRALRAEDHTPASPNIIEYIDYRGHQVLAVSRSLYRGDIILVVKIDKKEALAPISSRWKTTTMVSIALTLLVLLVSIIIARSITRPIHQLTEAATRISENDFSGKIPITSADELALLSETFNSMTGSLATAKDNLEKKIKELNREVKERKLAEAKARDNEAFLQSIFRSSPIGMGMLFDRVLLWTNDKMTSICGYSKEELSGQGLHILYPGEEEYHHAMAEYTEQLTKLGTGSVETRWQRKDGRIVDILFSISHLDPTNTSAGSTFTAMDITSRKNAEKELLASEARYREIFNAPDDAIFILDAETGGIFDVNQTMLDMYGYSYDEALQISVGHLSAGIAPYTEEDVLSHLRRAREEGPQLFQLRSKKKSGVLFWSEVSLKLWQTEEKDYVIAVVRNIDDRKDAEARLLKQKEEWERTFNAISDLITIQDRDFRIQLANKSSRSVYHQDPDKLQGRFCYEIFHGFSAPCPECPALRTLEDGDHHTQTIQHEGSGRTYHVSASLVPGDEPGSEHVVMVTKDITEHKRLEEELLQAHKMEAIGTLAGGIAHDFNNILTAVLGYAELARLEIQEGKNPAKDIEEVITASQRAKNLVSQILTFSRKGVHRREPLSPHLILKESLKLLRASLPSTITIHQNIDPESGTILADPTHIQQVIVNLCTNALHAMEKERGTLSIKLARCELGNEDVRDETGVDPGSFIELTVSDTGCGMDQMTMDRIFEPYFTTKEVGKGTGMGLAVVHGIIRDYHGMLKVESAPDKGSTFRIFFPAMAQDADRGAEEQAQEGPPRGSGHILVVDDEKLIVRLQKSLLERLGYTVTTKTSSLEAFEAFRADPDAFDLVLTDQTMPEKTGIELAADILAIRPGFPVILCTGFSSQVGKEDARKQGIKEFIMKPVKSWELAQAVRNSLAGYGPDRD